MSPQQLFIEVLKKAGTRFGVTNPIGPYGVADYGQCTAVPHLVQKLLGLPIVYGNAADIYDNASPEDYQKLGPNATPRLGDIVIWGQNAVINTGPEGHVALYEGPMGGGNFQSLDQNWPTRAFTQRVIHSKVGIKGYLRPKVLTSKVTEDSFMGVSAKDWSVEAVRGFIKEVTGVSHSRADILKNHAGKSRPKIYAEFFPSKEYEKQLNKVYELAYGRPATPSELASKRHAKAGVPQVALELLKSTGKALRR